MQRPLPHFEPKKGNTILPMELLWRLATARLSEEADAIKAVGTTENNITKKTKNKKKNRKQNKNKNDSNYALVNIRRMFMKDFLYYRFTQEYSKYNQ